MAHMSEEANDSYVSFIATIHTAMQLTKEETLPENRQSNSSEQPYMNTTEPEEPPEEEIGTMRCHSMQEMTQMVRAPAPRIV